MSSKVIFTPLCGCYDNDPLCYLLQMDDIHILLDCGWDERFNINDSHIQQLKKLVNKIDIVLLTQSDIYHIGALPYLVGELGLLKSQQESSKSASSNIKQTTTPGPTAQIFGTLPLQKMGIMTMYDLYQRLSYVKDDFKVFNLDDVDTAFDSITLLKYSQRYRYKNEKTGGVLTIIPFNSGHTLGGTIWKIIKEMDEIVYAVDYNHRKELHINGAQLGALGKPSVLITDTYSAQNHTNYKLQTKRIIEKIEEALEKGNVLLPCDPASRSLELALLLETRWKANPKLQKYPIIFLSTMSFRTIEFASHQLEWMSEEVMKAFDEMRQNPFAFTHVHLCQDLDTMQKIQQYRNQPCVILATSETMENGFSRELFFKLAHDERNLVLFTNQSTVFDGSLARRLIDYALRKKNVNGNGATQSELELDLEYRKRVPLQGQELKEYEMQQQKLKDMEKRKRDEEKRKKAQGKLIKIRDEDVGIESDSDDEMDLVSILNEESVSGTSLAAKDSKAGTAISAADRVQSRLFLPENMRYHSQYLMFPSIEYFPKSDAFGQWIDVEELKNRATMVYEAENAHNIGAREGDKMELEEDVQHNAPVIPTKVVSELIHLKVLCKIDFLDFEGRSNAQSVQTILKQLAPRKLLLVHGSPQNTQTLLDYCMNVKFCDFVQAPYVAEGCEVSMDTNMFRVKLHQGLFNNLHWIKANAYDLGYIQGTYQFLSTPGNIPYSGRADEEDLSKLPTIVPINNGASNDTTANVMNYNLKRDSIYVGDVKLSQFFDILTKNGIRAEFIQGGHLVCNDAVILKRDGKTGQITLDGALCSDYFRIRSLLYNQYQVL